MHTMNMSMLFVAGALTAIWLCAVSLRCAFVVYTARVAAFARRRAGRSLPFTDSYVDQALREAFTNPTPVVFDELLCLDRRNEAMLVQIQERRLVEMAAHGTRR